MTDIKEIAKFILAGLGALCGLYIAARMITRAILRTIDENKERKNRNG